MKAIQVVQGDDGSPQLVWTEVPDPSPGPQEVLLEVHATSVNRADLAQAAGHYPPPPGAPEILGLDAAGVVAAVGPEVEGWQVGDRACALLAGGGYAEQVAVDHRLLMPIPKGWSFQEAACLPEVYLTAFVNIFVEAEFQPGQAVLVHGGASGVGTAAIQLVDHGGGRILVTAGKPAKVALCRRLGAHRVVDYTQEDFVQAALEFTDGVGVHIVLDMVGAPYLARNLQALAPTGRLVFIATLGGSVAELDIRRLMARRQRLIGSVLRSRSVEEKAAIIRGFRERFWPALESGAIRPVIDRVFPIQEAQAAHEYMREFRNLGKIVLQVRP